MPVIQLAFENFQRFLCVKIQRLFYALIAADREDRLIELAIF
jgi:hypothetical protein